MKQLADITLPDGMVWQNQFVSDYFQYQVERTLAGQVIFYPQTPLRRVLLLAGEESVWLSGEAVAQLQNLLSQAGAVFPLVWGEQTFSAMFAHDAPPALEMKELWPGSDRFIGKIVLFLYN
ncbi:MAG: hypothetical protein G8345_04335 [Magnetococcales bacterium]|nr:hypothetical protein [Magnetococcales bacterium]NGZ26099.1 hypothetical protein [Magnetococcales bacterium]